MKVGAAMKLRELIVANMDWDETTILLISHLSEPVAPDRLKLRFAEPLYGDDRVRWFAGNHVVLD